MYIRLENVTKIYGKKDDKVEALRGITVDLEVGEMVAVMGKQDSKVNWSSSNVSVAKVTNNGKIIAKRREKQLLM